MYRYTRVVHRTSPHVVRTRVGQHSRDGSGSRHAAILQLLLLCDVGSKLDLVDHDDHLVDHDDVVDDDDDDIDERTRDLACNGRTDVRR